MRQFWLLILFMITPLAAQGQSQTQTITGYIYDEASGAPLPGAIISVTDQVPAKGTASDSAGKFKIAGVSIGRHSFRITYISFEDKALSDVEVTAGKEVNLNIGMQEQVKKLKEVTVAYSRSQDKNNTINDMAMVSARSFNVDETKRYAGANGDPSRMAANFAGVSAGDDSRNDIVVRGNSPNGMLWQIDGLASPNPNHFGALNSTGGPISMLNNNNIDKSDFLTGAFPAQYGNAVAAVFDIRLREGNSDKQEYVAQVGFNGFEAGIEGPIGKDKQTSYLVNYRYSTLGIFNKLGIDLGVGSAVPIYQDLNYKIVSHPGKKTKISLFGIAGSSSVDFMGKDIDTTKADFYSSGDPFQNQHDWYATTITGLSLDHQLSDRSSMRLVAGYCTTLEGYRADSLSHDYDTTYPRASALFKTKKASLSWTYLHKFSAKDNIQTGASYEYTHFSLLNKEATGTDPYKVYADQNGGTGLAKAYAQWKHRYTDRLSSVCGFDVLYMDLNSNSRAIEPRASLRYSINSRNAVSLGYGLHNQEQTIYTYFVQTPAAAGSVLTNKDLGFTRSNHIVASYDLNVNRNMRVKVETYYQYLDRMPVTSFPSSYSAVNEGISFDPPNQDSLVNKGTGRNFGLELTVEHFLTRGFYFLVTGSLFDSKYKGSDGVLRNTAYNTGYAANILGGKEFRIGRTGSIIALNLKMSTIGGKYLTPLDLAASKLAQTEVYDDGLAYSVKQQPYFRIDFKISYKKEFRKSTMEFSIDLENLTDRQNIFNETYNAKTNQIVYNYQQGFIPIPLFRWTF